MRDQRGFASLIAELIACAMALIIAAAAYPAITAWQRAQSETQALGNMQTLVAAENTNSSLYSAYASLTLLGTCLGSGLSNVAPCLTSKAFASGSVQNYTYTYTAETNPLQPTSTIGYLIVARPTSGLRIDGVQYCATNSVPGYGYVVDGLIHQIQSMTTVTAAECQAALVASNSGQGPTGPPGITNGGSVSSNATLVSNGATVVVASGMALPAGNYLVTGSVGGMVLQASSCTGTPCLWPAGYAVCSLTDSQSLLSFGSANNKAFAVGTTATNVWNGLTLTAALAVPSSGDTVSITCQPNIAVSIGPSKISAVQVTNLAL